MFQTGVTEFSVDASGTQVPEHLYHRSDWDRDLPQDWELGKLLLSQVLPVDSEPASGTLEFL